MLSLITTPTIPREPGTPGIENEPSHRMCGTNPSSPPTTSTLRTSTLTPRPPTSPGRHWPCPGLGMGTTHPPTMSATLSPRFGETRYPSLPREEIESHKSHSCSGLTSLTAVTAPTSPITNSDSEEPTPLALRLRNPFLALIIAAQQTPSTLRGLTTSGMHSNRSTETSSVQNESKHGSFDKRTSKPGQTGNTEERTRTWNITSPPTEERRSTSANLPTARSWPESMPTTTRSYSAPIQVTDAQTYRHGQKRSIDSSMNDSNTSPSDSTSASIGRTTFGDFQYDWESVFLGYNPEDANWEDPRPLANSPPNPRFPGFYSGPTTSRLIAGAGLGGDMEDMGDPWGDHAPGPPPVPLAGPPQDRTDQLIQQVALLQDENLRLQNDNAPHSEAGLVRPPIAQTQIITRFRDHPDGHHQALDQSATGMPMNPRPSSKQG